MPQAKEICHSGKGYKTISEAFEALLTGTTTGTVSPEKF